MRVRAAYLPKQSVILLLLVLVATSAAWADAREAAPVELQLAFLGEGPVSAYEPVLATVTLTSRAKNMILVPCRAGEGLLAQVKDSTGKPVAALPVSSQSPEGLGSAIELAPGQSEQRTWVVTGFYTFAQPGTYEVEIMARQRSALKNGWEAVARASASLRVVPFDRTRLENRCQELVAPKAAAAKLPELVRRRALYSVRQDTVLPFLEWLVVHRHDPEALRAIRRVGTPRAERLAKALADSPGEVGRTAKAGMRLPPATGPSDVDCNER